MGSDDDRSRVEVKTGRTRGPVEQAKVNAAQVAAVASMVLFVVVIAILLKWAGG